MMTENRQEPRIYKFLIASDEVILQEREGCEPFEWSGLLCVVVATSLEDARRRGTEYLNGIGELSEWLRFAPYESFPLMPGVVAWASV